MVNDRDERREIQAALSTTTTTTTTTTIAPLKDMVIQRRLQQPQPPRTSLPRRNNSLQRNPSVTSTHSSSNNSSNSNNSFPTSPATSLSALSKNSSNISCSGSSSMASGRMSVDDILSSSGRQTKRRRIHDRIHEKIHTSSTNDTKKLVKNMPVTSAKRRLQEYDPKYHHPMNHPINHHYNPGQEDRKKRLERMQQEQLQRHRLRLRGVGRKSQKLASKGKKNLIKLEKMIQEEMLENEHARDNQDGEEEEEEEEMSPSSSSSRVRRMQQIIRTELPKSEEEPPIDQMMEKNEDPSSDKKTHWSHKKEHYNEAKDSAISSHEECPSSSRGPNASSSSSSSSSSSNRKNNAMTTTAEHHHHHHHLLLPQQSKRPTPRIRSSNRAKNDALSEISTTAAITSTPPRTTTASKRKTPSSPEKEEKGRGNAAGASPPPSSSSSSACEKESPPSSPPPEAMEEPECALSALSALLSKYRSWARRTPSSSSSSSSGGEYSKTTPWNVVQHFISVLGFLQLHDPDWHGGEECREVETGLVGVLASVDGVKRNVMNRDNSDTAHGDPMLQGDDGGEGEEEDGRSVVERRDAKLLEIIQIQVWLRMMVWNLEQDVGWKFLGRVVALAEARDAELSSKDGAPSSSVDVDLKSKGKKSKKNKKSKSKGGDDDDKQSATKKKKKQPIITAPPRESLVRDVRTLAELAPYVLPPSSDFARWLKSTLTFGHRQTVPEYGAELFDHFEIDAVVEPATFGRNGSTASSSSHSRASRRSERSEASRSPAKKGGDGSVGAMGGSPTKRLMERRNERQRAYFASLVEESKAPGVDDDDDDDESATITGSTITGSLSTVTSVSRSSSVREKDDAALFKTSLSLVSSNTATQNPFLKGSARGNYVGNHFNAKLSNITSLFREVKAPPKPKLVPPAEKRRKDPALRRSKSLPEKRSAPANQSRRRPTTAKTRLLASTPPNGTPRKLPLSPAASSSSFRKASAPLFQVDETPLRPIFEETPAPKQPRQRSFINARDDDDDHHPLNAAGIRSLAGSIVVETPQRREPSPRGGGGTVRPTTLWGAPDPSRRGRNDDDDAATATADSITPVRRHPRRASATSSSFGVSSSSPMPHRTDLGSVVARAAKAYNARKKK